MAAFQVRIAYLTPRRRTRHYFYQVVLAEDRRGALANGRWQLARRSPYAHVIHEVATLRKDSQDAELVMLGGWRLCDGWWTRPVRVGDDLAAIAFHGYVKNKRIVTRTTAECIAIDRDSEAVRRESLRPICCFHR